MRYAVEARIYDNGKIITRVRPAAVTEQNHCVEMSRCDIWVDVFDNEDEACAFCKSYRKA